jgi:hypothetical protein
MKIVLIILGCLFLLAIFGLVAFMVYGGFLALSSIDLDHDDEDDLIFKYDPQWNKYE